MQKEIQFDEEAVATYFTLYGVGICLIFTLLFGIGLILAPLYWFFIARWLSPLQSQKMRYRLEPATLRIDKGVFFLSRQAIPLDRITDLELVQGPLMGLLNIWALRVQTAGAGLQTPEATLYGIEEPERVREEILGARDAYIETRRSL